MTRRITLSVLALVVALLVLAVVPLGITMTDRERESFHGETEAGARAVASAAEEYLADHKPEAVARAGVDEAAEHGACAQVYDGTGHLLMSTPCTHTAGSPEKLVAEALAKNEQTQAQSDDLLTLAVPIGDSGPPVGVAVFTRTTHSLDTRLTEIWGWLALCAFGALCACFLVAALLARWVGRPLRTLDEAAVRLGSGALDTRAPTDEGPPEVRRLATSFNTMAGRTEALVYGHRAVVADVSHQLRTPLSALRLRLDLLAADADADTARELAGAQEEIARLSRLVDGLLAVARAENSVPTPQPVRVKAVVADRVAAWEPVAAEKDVALTGTSRGAVVASLGEGDLEQILDNLVANAVEAARNGGVVRIHAERTNANVRLTVADNGPGMEPAARERAFLRYGNPQAGGAGLGLAIVHRLVTANGGEVSLEDTPGGGLTVRMTFPAAGKQRS